MPSQFATSTTFPTETVTWNNQAANTVLAGPTTGSASAPTFRALVAADINAAGAITGTLTSGRVLYSTGTNTVATSGNFTYNGSAFGLSGDITVSSGIHSITSTNNNPWRFTAGDSYNVTPLANSTNFFGTGINFAGVLIGNVRGYIGMNKSAIGSLVPANSIVFGGISPGAMVAMMDYSNEPMVAVNVVSSTESNLNLNLGYKGWQGGVGVLTNAAANAVRIKGPLGTGTGATGDIIFQTGNSAASGTTGHTLSDRVTFKGGTGAVGINTTSPDASAQLDIVSTTTGVLFPRMTSTQRDAISSPATGLTLYCTDCTATDASTGVMQVYNGSTWKNCW